MDYPVIITSSHIIKVSPSKSNKRTMTGEQEYYFYEFLLPYIGNKLKFKYEIKFNSIDYYPDLIYWDEENNIAIDIELDEPYNRADKPIHCLDDERDNYRNNIFYINGWSIIRFSEYQVVRFKDDCIKLIKEVVNSLLKKDPFVINKTNYSSLFIHTRWNEHSSKEMAKNSIRDRYGFKLKNKLNEGETSIKLKFDDREDFANFLLEQLNYQYQCEDLDRRYEYFFYITDISDVLFDEENEKEYIFIKVNYSETKIEGIRSLSSKVPLGYKLEKGSDLSINLIEEKKKGKQIYVKHYKDFFNFFFKGKRSVPEAELNDYVEIKNQREKGDSIFVKLFFSLPESYFN